MSDLNSSRQKFVEEKFTKQDPKLAESIDQRKIKEKIVSFEGKIKPRYYRRGDQLGKGAFGNVYKFHHFHKKKNEYHVSAGKELLKKENKEELKEQKKKLFNEIQIHKLMKHENICEFEHFFEDSECVYMLLEICSDVSLYDMLEKRKRLLEIEVKTYTLQILDAIQHIHSKKVIHRDLKLGNILIKEIEYHDGIEKANGLQLKISDFGLATKVDYFCERKTDTCGTPNYMAPELIENDPEKGHSYEVDIWALGVIIYTLLVGKPPFETADKDIKHTYRLIQKCQFQFPQPDINVIDISEAAKDLIRRILVREPKKRPSIDNIRKHPWLMNNMC